MPANPSPTYFATPADFRAWLKAHHETAGELWVGFYKKASGKPSITWPESVDEALCFGWIDGLRKSVDDHSYTIRFTPRKPRSTWSAINVKRVGELIAEGRMRPAGLKAFQKRTENNTGVYSFERQQPAAFDPAHEQLFRASAAAWDFFQKQAPGYRRLTTHWVNSAKKEETRRTRLATLIECSAQGRAIPALARRPAPVRPPQEKQA